MSIVVGLDIKPPAQGEATAAYPGGRLPRRGTLRGHPDTEDPNLARFLALALLVVILGGVVFLATWEIPPPTAEVETVIPDERLPR